MKMRATVLMFFVFVFVGGVIGWASASSGYSYPATWLLSAPALIATYGSALTVFTYGRLELQREAASAFVAYAVLAGLAAMAFVVGEPVVLDKYLDAFLFGQAVALLSIAKACVQAWGDPVPPEDPTQRAVRHAAASSVRRAGLRALIGKK
jgi:hypothetical protein